MTESSPTPRGAEVSHRSLSVEQYERFAPLVRRAAIRFARQIASNVDVSEIIGAGLVGLVDAVKRADPTAAPEQTDQYIWYRVRAAMLDYVRGFDARTRNLQAVSRRLTRAIKSLTGSLGRAPEEGEIAEAMELEILAYRRTLTALARAGMTQLMLGDAALEPDAAEPLDDASGPASEPASTVDALARAVEQLPIVSQQILALHHQEDCTPCEIAAVLDLTEARVVQLHIEAIHRLRAGIGRS